jgi:hypothetical protein
METGREGLMRSRAFAVLAAALLLAGGTASAAAAEQWSDGSTGRVATEQGGVGALLPADPSIGGGLGQWIWPGVAGGPYGGFATPQTAAFFGYGNQQNPVYQAALVGSIGNYTGTQLQGFNALSGLNQTGLAPASALSLNSLINLGVATSGVGPTGNTVFGIGGLGFPLFPGQTLGNTSLAQFPGYPAAGSVPLGFTGLNPFLGQLGLNFLR